MDSPRWLLLAAGCWLLLPPGDCGLETRALHSFYPEELPPPSIQREGAARVFAEALEKLQKKRIPPWGKKLGQVPACDLGELCALRKASRIGKLCNCPRGPTCNFFLLKCL
ncbi:cocaine- and amphetamine-regulated transcript protein-like [Gopherus flavomarginatus]|uniref:cocaine- and amphetamine-regulated transcript protein-like n=1 Tax=Gopherus flavomarginatus TaxID=286002 RepID=UPI0021CBCE8D|nr:cocaine- and amphetamine-regulated transcript protein-like [Gopherus flavomarginatus]